MRNAPLHLWVLLWLLMAPLGAEAQQWRLLSDAQATGGDSVTPFAGLLTDCRAAASEHFPAGGTVPLVPLEIRQLMVSLVDTSDRAAPSGKMPTLSFSGLHLGAGVQRSRLPVNHAGLSSDSTPATGNVSSVMFVGIGLDFTTLYLKGSAVMGRAAKSLPDARLSPSPLPLSGSRRAVGFEASAGVRVNENLSLGAGVETVRQAHRKEVAEENVFAVYAQAVLHIAPGVQLIPEVGQVERKSGNNPSEPSPGFYAGAKWEINF